MPCDFYNHDSTYVVFYTLIRRYQWDLKPIAIGMIFLFSLATQDGALSAKLDLLAAAGCALTFGVARIASIIYSIIEYNSGEFGLRSKGWIGKDFIRLKKACSLSRVLLLPYFLKMWRFILLHTQID